MASFAQLEKEILQIQLTHHEASQLLAVLRDSSCFYLERGVVQQLEAQHFFDTSEEKQMTYSSFKNLKMVEEISPLVLEINNQIFSPIQTTITGQRLFAEVSPKQPSEWLLDTLAINKKTPLMSEKSRSEGLIRPILLELLRANTDTFTLFSGETFEVYPNYGLTGECDFLLSLSPETNFIQTPVFALVEAKKKSIEEGLGQCAAQMIAARELNQLENQALPAVFGCVSTGEIWQFLKLEGQLLTIDKEKYYEKLELDKILGILQSIVDSYPTD